MPNPDIDKIINKDTNAEYLIKDTAARDDKMDKVNPTGTGAFTMNDRRVGSSVGSRSATLGYVNEASGSCSIAVGIDNRASGQNSFSEGEYNTSSGQGSHTEGSHNTASGIYSHAENANNTASGNYSHASGWNTEAAGENQFVFGKFNIPDTTSVEIVGYGSDIDNKKNIRKLDRYGNETIAGDFYFNGGNDSLSTQLAKMPGGYSEAGDNTGNVVSSASWSILSSVQITKGLWLINYGANFPSLGSGNTGHCGVGVSDSSTATTAPAVNMRMTGPRITNDNYTTLSSSCLYDCTSDTKTLYLKVRQTSGQSLSVEGKLRVVKIA